MPGRVGKDGLVQHTPMAVVYLVQIQKVQAAGRAGGIIQ